MRHIQRGIATSVILIIFLIAGVAITSSYLIFYQNQQKLKSINSFKDCAKYYSVMESYPEQCSTPDGKHFFRGLTDKEKQELIPPQDPSSIQTDNWKKYTNTKIGFEVEYPADYENPKLPSGPGPNEYATGVEERSNILFEGGSSFFWIHVFPFDKSLEELIVARKNISEDNFKIFPYWTGDFPIEQIDSSKIGGQEAKWFLVRHLTADEYSKINPTIEVYFVGKNYGFLVNSNKNSQEQLRTILSTFKFIN